MSVSIFFFFDSYYHRHLCVGYLRLIVSVLADTKMFQTGTTRKGVGHGGSLDCHEWMTMCSPFTFFLWGLLCTRMYMYIHIQGSVAPVTPTPLPFFFIFFYYDITPPCYSTRVFFPSFLGVLHEPVDGMCDARKIYTPHSFCTSICLFMYLILFFEIRFSSIIRIHSICYYFLFIIKTRFS